MAEKKENLTAEQKKLKALYERYEKEHMAKLGITEQVKTERTEKIERKPIPKPETLKIKRTVRSFIPGVFEYFTDDPDFIFMLPEKIRTKLNIAFMIVPLFFAYLIFTDSSSTLYFLFLFLTVVVAEILQQLTISIAVKRNIMEVYRFGETPYTRLKNKKK